MLICFVLDETIVWMHPYCSRIPVYNSNKNLVYRYNSQLHHVMCIVCLEKFTGDGKPLHGRESCNCFVHLLDFFFAFLTFPSAEEFAEYAVTF